MRNREEFRELVYRKRDEMKAERAAEIIKKRRMQRVVSSLAAACFVVALALPILKLYPFGGSHREPMDDGMGVGSWGDRVEEIAPSPGSAGEVFEEDEPDAPADTEIDNEYEGKEEYDGPSSPNETGVTVVDPDEPSGEKESGASTEKPNRPGENVWSHEEELFVKFSYTLSTEPLNYPNIGRLTEVPDEDFLIIKDYETLKELFDRLSGEIKTEGLFEPELFERCFVVMLVREEGDPGDAHVEYSDPKLRDGVLSLGRRYTYSDEYDVPAVEAACVDFVVIHSDCGCDLTINFADIIKIGENQ